MYLSYEHRFSFRLISSISNIVTGDPESTIVLNGFPFIFPLLENCPFSSPSIVSTILSSSTTEPELLSSLPSILWILCARTLITLLLFARFPAPFVWQHFAKWPLCSAFNTRDGHHFTFFEVLWTKWGFATKRLFSWLPAFDSCVYVVYLIWFSLYAWYIQFIK